MPKGRVGSVEWCSREVCCLVYVLEFSANVSLGVASHGFGVRPAGGMEL